MIASMRDITAQVAVERAMRAQGERIGLLDEFARALASRLDLSSLLVHAVERVAELVPCRRCHIARYEPQTDTIHIEAVAMPGSRPPGQTVWPVGSSLPAAETLSGQAVLTRKPATVQDTEADPARWSLLLRDGIRSALAVPIVVDGSIWGTLAIGFDVAHGVPEGLISFVSTVASHVGVAAHNARLFTSLREANEQLQATQAQVIQQERLRALGQMASGIAHDFNNALAPIAGFSELLLTLPDGLVDQERLRHYLELMHTSAQDAANVVSRLREFYRSRDVADPLEAVDVSQLARQAVVLTQPRWKDQAQAQGSPIEVRLELAEVPTIGGNVAELREALTNLIFNAVDAMAGGGTLTVSTRQAHVTAEHGEQVVLSVADTGSGMSEDVRLRCLEPFFSTKGDRGTGLGLSMVHGIVHRHGGTLHIESAPGAGTTVELRLPAGMAETGAGAGRLDAAPAKASRRLRVLVADDDAPVRQVTVSFLEADGHEVIEAANGAEAAAMFAPEAYDLVVTDRAMPDTSGDRLAAQFKAQAPHLPIILLTGFGDLLLAEGAPPPGVDLVLSKPATLQELRAAVASLIPSEEGGGQ
jgi:signal transduction histidine kinase/ActR/RegA family two-component response regulator